MKSNMLGALALITLIGALFVMQSAEQHSPTADAATGTIHALNVGTCLTTSTDVFSGDCASLDNDGEGWEVRDQIMEVSTLYATYAHDPRTASDQPRAIIEDSDLIRIRIADAGRDKRTGVLIRGAGSGGTSDDLNNEAGLGAEIKADLDGDNLDYPMNDNDGNIEFGSEDVNAGDGIYFTLRSVDTIIVNASGTHVLNFTRAGQIGTAGGAWQFAAGDFDVANGAIVRFYGCVDADLSATCDPNELSRTGVLDNEIQVDEDTSNGHASGDTAPWLGINASVPADSQILIQAIYYQTSEQENLVGGEQYCVGADDGVGSDGTCPAGTTEMSNDITNVVYTSREKETNQSLQVMASSDGDSAGSVHLHLQEMTRFGGVYEGYLRLTDSDGDGRSNSADGMTRDNWGREVRNGTGETDADADAAVLDVESGPVTITYRDSDGDRQTLRIEIDKQPPSIEVTSPSNASSSVDLSPDFLGNIEDIDSGLADRSFRLVVDNAVDDGDANSDFVLDDRAPNADSVMAGEGLSVVTHIGEYGGYGDSPNDLLGIVEASSLYNLGDDACGNQNMCHITSDAYSDGANRGMFDDSVRLNLRDGNDDAEIRDREYGVDFQAFVMDMAGNIGFSDSDPANPRFINALGVPAADRNAPNVLGYYSAHVITLDSKDPVILAGKSATGYYGLDSNNMPSVDRSGVMVVFDGPVVPDSVSTETFSVELDDETMGAVVDVNVAKNYVFLKLGSELASDATPMIDIASGEKVEDAAGNETYGREVDAFEAQDGISPRLMVTLSGGSGTGTGDTGPSKLTKDQMTIHVTSDEALQGAPKIAVVCSALRWNQDSAEMAAENNVDSRHDVADYVANRDGAFTGEPSESPVTTTPRSTNSAAAGQNYQYTCGYDANDDNFNDNFVPTVVSSLSRPGDNWEFTWRNQTGAQQMLNDGALTVVAYGRDRSRYEAAASTDLLQNWASASAEFTYDTVLRDPTQPAGGDVQPDPDGTSKEVRPFVLIEFNENTQVTLETVELDNVEIGDQFEQTQMNRFVYWPESMSQGAHEIEVKALDEAGNDRVFEFGFTVEARGKFLIELQAGWNAVSVPANPVSTAIGSVFSDPSVETVIGWDTQGWRIAVRRDGVWESNQQYGTLNEIRAKYGYWVKSRTFITQPVALDGGLSRNISGAPSLIGIDTLPGWNFVGVIDQEGDQTEDHFGVTLQDSQNNPVTAREYLNDSYVRAYTWDPTFSRFDVLRENDTMTIGDGVWVYYPESSGIAP